MTKDEIESTNAKAYGPAANAAEFVCAPIRPAPDPEARRQDASAAPSPPESGEGVALLGIDRHRSGSIARSTARPLSVNARSPAPSRFTNPFTSLM
jgi:hypothetical protein